MQPRAKEFYDYSQQFAEALSQPQIMYKARLQTGQEIIVDDYREAYFWLRDHTPADARVMAWWDYGYQITGIGNRTTIADGNTWNHEHIATLGKILSAPEDEAHKIARHLADYILVWAGGGGDDLAKSPHMARIGNSVFLDICPDDPTCSKFGFYQGGIPTPMMEKCLLYKMVQYGTMGRVSDVAPHMHAQPRSSHRPLLPLKAARAFKARVHVQVWQGAHLQGEVGLEEEQRYWVATHSTGRPRHAASSSSSPRLLSLQVAATRRDRGTARASTRRR